MTMTIATMTAAAAAVTASTPPWRSWWR
jgi:hypothetical protein